ncbi:MAG: HAD hydrolase-like protein [Treponemataceae bacterium]
MIEFKYDVCNIFFLLCYNEIMSKFEHIFFDFDGTLFDTSLGIFNSFDYLAKYYKLNIDKSLYSKMIGPPLRESFLNILKFNNEELEKAMSIFKEYYGKKGKFECSVYPDVSAMLEVLKNNGKKSYIATCKPEIFARQIIEKKKLSGMFEFVGGSDFEENDRIEKKDVINYVLKENSLDKKEKILMVGDRFYDVQGAHEVGIQCCGILWGFGSEQELVTHGADFICKTPQNLLELILI